MRNMLLLATAATFVVFGAVAAYAANPNVPSYSPYALIDVPPASGPMGLNSGNGFDATHEVRASAFESGPGGAASAPTWSGPGYSPYATMVH